MIFIYTTSSICNASTSCGLIIFPLGNSKNCKQDTVPTSSPAYHYAMPRYFYQYLYFPKVLIDHGYFLVQEYSVSPQGVAALTAPQALLRHMQGHSIHCIASGGQSPNFKFFFFAQKAEESSTFLVECVINTSSAKAQMKIKADDQSVSEAFSALFQSALSKFGMP